MALTQLITQSDDATKVKSCKGMGLQSKMVLFAAIITMVTLEFSGVLTYIDEKRQLQDLHARELLAVVNSISAFIDGDAHESIFINLGILRTPIENSCSQLIVGLVEHKIGIGNLASLSLFLALLDLPITPSLL